MKITILGSGASTGVPLIGCRCAVCQSDNPKNKRLRVSIFIETPEVRLLIDTSPDLRQQALAHHLTRIDAVLFTHEHSDHSHGIDDLKRFNQMQGHIIEAFSDKRAIDILKTRFPFAFAMSTGQFRWYKACLSANIITPYQAFSYKNLEILPFLQTHGAITSLGFRIGDFAYSTDVNALDEKAFSALSGIKYWVVDCQGISQSFSHSHLKQTLDWIARVKPKKAILTHMGHELEYEKLKAELPYHILPGYDGMVLEI